MWRKEWKIEFKTTSDQYNRMNIVYAWKSTELLFAASTIPSFDIASSVHKSMRAFERNHSFFYLTLFSWESKLECMWHSEECAHEWRASEPLPWTMNIAHIFIGKSLSFAWKWCFDWSLKRILRGRRREKKRRKIIFYQSKSQRSATATVFMFQFFGNNIVAYSIVRSIVSYFMGLDIFLIHTLHERKP